MALTKRMMELEMSDEPEIKEDIVRTEPFTGMHAEFHELKHAHDKLQKAHARLKEEHAELMTKKDHGKKGAHGK